ILFCKLFVELHKLDWKPFISDLESDGENIPTIDSYIERLEDRVIRNKLTELQPILVWLKEKRKKIGKIQLALSHFDFHPFNILLNEKGEPFVIDWPAGRVSDYRFDLGWTLTLIMVYSNRENRNGIFEAYQAIANEQIEDIDFFEVVAILRRLSDILIVFNSNAENAGLHDGVAKMIKETISHVENLNSYLEELSGISIPAIDALVEKVKNE
ncbi:MAG: phosphotransferase, partial [Candidatus Heimdallarchaeota archaeon]